MYAAGCGEILKLQVLDLYSFWLSNRIYWFSFISSFNINMFCRDVEWQVYVQNGRAIWKQKLRLVSILYPPNFTIHFVCLQLSSYILQCLEVLYLMYIVSSLSQSTTDLANNPSTLSSGTSRSLPRRSSNPQTDNENGLSAANEHLLQEYTRKVSAVQWTAISCF